MGEEIYVMQECAECRKSTSGKCAKHLQSGKIDDRYFDIRLNNKTLSALRRYMTASMYDTRANDIISAEQFGADNIDICAWLDRDCRTHEAGQRSRPDCAGRRGVAPQQ